VRSGWFVSSAVKARRNTLPPSDVWRLQGTHFTVIVTEGRPDATGLRMARALADVGVPVTLVLDSAVAFAMDRWVRVRRGAGRRVVRARVGGHVDGVSVRAATTNDSIHTAECVVRRCALPGIDPGLLLGSAAWIGVLISTRSVCCVLMTARTE
jgi:hypothetical protein